MKIEEKKKNFYVTKKKILIFEDNKILFFLFFPLILLVGKNRPSQKKRRQARARRENLLHQIGEQLENEGIVDKELHEKLLFNFLKVPVENRELIFGNSFCKECIVCIPKFRCVKCFMKCTKFKKVEKYVPKKIKSEKKIVKIQEHKPRINTVVDNADLELLTLDQKLERIGNSFCKKHLRESSASNCIDCLQKQYEISTKFLCKDN